MKYNKVYLQTKLLNKLYNKFFLYSNILTIYSYKRNIPNNFLNFFLKKIRFLIYLISIYINFLILYIRISLILNILLI